MAQLPADGRRPHGCSSSIKEELVLKARLFNMAMAVAMLAALVESLGAVAKWR